MIARKYNRKISIYHTTNVADGYGGNTVTDVLIGEFWAEVKQNSSFQSNNIGKLDIKNVWQFNIRGTNLIQSGIDNLSIQYNGNKYVVVEVTKSDVLFREISIVANGG